MAHLKCNQNIYVYFNSIECSFPLKGSNINNWGINIVHVLILIPWEAILLLRRLMLSWFKIKIWVHINKPFNFMMAYIPVKKKRFADFNVC